MPRATACRRAAAAAAGALRAVQPAGRLARLGSRLAPPRPYCTRPDFAAHPTSSGSPEERAQVLAEMRRDIADLRVVLFMKGEPEAPRCGFSNRAVELLHQYGIAYTSYNVLAHPAVREGVKEISGWPTIPQLFVRGDFIGGCDILLEMHNAGHLTKMLQEKGVAHRDPVTGAIFTPAPTGGAGTGEGPPAATAEA
eukprot:TRINITY_DN38831_c0_g1_i1.p1 TRINITY_DN38831_c0_g1~~TRINITY_DN38831_c0_g1_i1.p1  ORF type:complete len:218 (+),score=49.19 TRINITY_DN38831_c0_g1_i1:67-654(+)